MLITGTDTDVGKTFVASAIVRELRDAGVRVGVYKPAASGADHTPQGLVSQDARSLWEAAGRPLTLADVCPQVFAAPLAPHLAARAEGRTLDAELLRTGLARWTDACDLVVVEGAGGLLSPLGDELVADLAVEFGYPAILVAADRIGVIHQTLAALAGATAYGVHVAGIVLNSLPRDHGDLSRATNPSELARHTSTPLLAQVREQGGFDRIVDWRQLAHAAAATSGPA